MAAERGYVDDVIMPSVTQPRIARAWAMLRTKTVECGQGSTIFAVGEQFSIVLQRA